MRQTFATGAQPFGQTNDVNGTSLQTNCSGFENLETLAKKKKKNEEKASVVWKMTDVLLEVLARVSSSRYVGCLKQKPGKLMWSFTFGIVL